PPQVGVVCDLAYYDGDPNFPHVSNFRWPEDTAPACELDGFIIQADPDTYIKIDAGRRILHVTPANAEASIGGDWLVKVEGDVRVEAGGTITHKTAGPVSGVVTQQCICALTGLPHIDKSSTVLASKE
ncbi:baseplate assembly protein, partial [Desulfocurvibacter africanus]